MVALIHEGKTDKEFFNNLLQSYNLPLLEDKIKYINFEGINNIFQVGNSNYDEIENEIKIGKISKMLIVVDADFKYEEHLKKLKETIENLAFDIPIDFYIMCDDNKEGNLESFLLSVLDDKQKECIKIFKNCYKYELTDKWTYNTFYRHKKYPFDFSHQNFDELKEKLTNLFN